MTAHAHAQHGAICATARWWNGRIEPWLDSRQMRRSAGAIVSRLGQAAHLRRGLLHLARRLAAIILQSRPSPRFFFPATSSDAVAGLSGSSMAGFLRSSVSATCDRWRCRFGRGRSPGKKRCREQQGSTTSAGWLKVEFGSFKPIGMATAPGVTLLQFQGYDLNGPVARTVGDLKSQFVAHLQHQDVFAENLALDSL
jgi:hypothetical protein